MSMSGSARGPLVRSLPYGRRYARAITGSQSRGDALVAAALRTLLEQPDAAAEQGEFRARLALYAAIGRQDRATGAANDGASGLSPRQRRLLLLTALEELDLAAAAAAEEIEEAEAGGELERAREQLRASAAARVLIIEDEPIIAMDIRQLVESAGHEVVGVAASEEEAVAIAEAERPGLVLADINLGAGGDGAHAVARILERHSAPVIFVTAYPERLLTGDAVEPAFVITKPFDPTMLAVATFQASSRGVALG